MAFTDQVTYDNLSLHAVVAPVACRKLTLRQLANDASLSPFNVVAPANTNAVFPMRPGEEVIFEAEADGLFQAGTTVAYIQPLNGTVTFSRLCE